MRTMAGSQDVPPDEVNPFRLDRCPDCGYLLEGLPEQGICPECGFAYRADMIVLYGWAAGSRANASNARGWTFVWCLVVGDMYLLLQICQHLLTRDLWGVALFLGVLIVCNGWLLYRRRNALQDIPRPEQLRLFSEGISQQTGVGKARLVPWSEVKWLAVNWRGGDRYQIEGEYDRHFWSRTSGTIHADVDLGSEEHAVVLRRLAKCFPNLRIYDIQDQTHVRRMQDLEKQYGLRQAACRPLQ